MDINVGKKKPPATFCFIKLETCEKKRKLARTEKYGKPTPCSTQKTAFCFQAISTEAMMRRIMCTRIPEDCEYTRKEAEEQLEDIDFFSECKALLNTDPFLEEIWFNLRLSPEVPEPAKSEPAPKPATP